MIAFGLTIFTGAFLLFLVQPLIAKFILPWFGGSPAVWTACLLFFQVFLLGGYAYADVSRRWFHPRVQAVVHLALLGVALAFLPIIPAAHWKPGPEEDPTYRILALLAATIGLPYLVLAATGPMMQQWFTWVRPGVSPYRFYALSNVGSLLALMAYPLAFEPWMTRRSQAGWWSMGLALYAVFTVACAIRVWLTAGARTHQSKIGDGQSPIADSNGVAGTEPSRSSSSETQASTSPLGTQRLSWVLFPATAVVLLMATTNKLCQDVAVIPFLWVLPLGLYLLSFILCFDSPQWYRRKFFGVALGVAVALLGVVLFEKTMPLLPQILIYCGTLFIACMVCHGELHRVRPDACHLTGFYLMIALGGALGGVFVAVVAPLIFNGYFELHGGVIVLGLALAWLHAREGSRWRVAGRMIPLGRAVLAVTFALAIPLWVEAHSSRGEVIAKLRNFYGVFTVYEEMKDDPWQRARLLQSGAITHGIQLAHPLRQWLPVSYYSERSGLGRLLRAMPPGPRRIGVIGLGAGSLAAYARAEDTVRFYEINPAVRRIAEEHFSFLRGATGRVEVVMGDARLSMEREPPQHYDLLVLDAFSGDAIPVHLLTREAFEIYRRHLTTNGMIAAHISNRHLDLRPVLEAHARQLGLGSVFIVAGTVNQPWWILRSQWFLFSGDESLLAHPDLRIAAEPPLDASRRLPQWTDDYASLLRVLK